MNVLFPVSEIASLYHLGGLGDVARSLPLALKGLGIDIRLAMAFHDSIVIDENWEKIDEFSVHYACNQELVEVWQANIPDSDVIVYLFANKNYLAQHSGVADEAIDKFVFFSLAVCHWLVHKKVNWQPEIVHLNDWHVAFIPSILKHLYNNKDYKTLLTIHNLNFQGTASRDIIRKLNFDLSLCKILNWDQGDGDVNLLMEGIIHADMVNAVSPTYAKEILTTEYGAFLDPVIHALQGKLTGILNGIDYKLWNPKTDPFIAANFDNSNMQEGKNKNKLALQKELQLPSNENSCLVGYVGRVDPNQKGVQLIIEAIKNNILGTPSQQFVFLGTGDTYLEDILIELANNNPNIKTVCKFDLELSHKIYAGSEIMVMPSKYEPCGLVQMIAMRYGTIPIARKTGGLADSVIDGETGFLFEEYSHHAFEHTLLKAFETLKNHTTLNKMQKSCLQVDFSWEQSAKHYYKLYLSLPGKYINNSL